MVRTGQLTIKCKAPFTHTRVQVRVRVYLSELPVTRTRATQTSGAFTFCTSPS